MTSTTNCLNKTRDCCIPLEIRQCFRSKKDLNGMLGQRQQLIQSLNGFDIGAIGSIGTIIGVVQKLIELEQKIFGHGTDATTPQPALQTEATVTKWGGRITLGCAFALAILALQSDGTSSTSGLGLDGNSTCVNGSMSFLNVTVPCVTTTSDCTLTGTETAYIIGVIVLIGATFFLHFLSDRSASKIATKNSTAAAFNALQTVGALQLLTPLDRHRFTAFSQAHRQVAHPNFAQANENIRNSQVADFVSAYRHAQSHFGSCIPQLSSDQISDYWHNRVVQPQNLGNQQHHQNNDEEVEQNI